MMHGIYAINFLKSIARISQSHCLNQISSSAKSLFMYFDKNAKAVFPSLKIPISIYLSAPIISIYWNIEPDRITTLRITNRICTI